MTSSAEFHNQRFTDIAGAQYANIHDLILVTINRCVIDAVEDGADKTMTPHPLSVVEGDIGVDRYTIHAEPVTGRRLIRVAERYAKEQF